MSRPDLILWRHGQTGWNAGGRFQGQTEVDLDDDGRRQVVVAAEVLAGLCPSVLVSSDARRAMDTAAALSGLVGLPVVPDARLREVDVGAWAGLTRDEVAARFPDEFAAWVAGEDFVRTGGGERYADVGARAWACLSSVLASAVPGSGPVVAVTHGGTSLSLVVEILGLPWEARRRIGPIGNARWTRFAAWGDEGWRLAEHNVGAPVPIGAEVRSE